MTAPLISALRGTGHALLDTYRLGGRTLVAAPLIVAIAVVPEFVQHVAEIKLGMFESVDRFRALANDPTRWTFGYAKVTGFILAILLTARFWGLDGSLRRTFAIRPVALLKLLLAIGAMTAAGWVLEQPGTQGAPRAVAVAAAIVSAVLQAGFAVLIVALLVEDEQITLRAAFVDRLPTALLTIVTAAAAFVPAQALHMANHRFALGQPGAVVWALMAWDSLLVGLLAALVGAALYVGYGCGLTWRGWVPAKRPNANI